VAGHEAPEQRHRRRPAPDRAGGARGPHAAGDRGLGVAGGHAVVGFGTEEERVRHGLIVRPDRLGGIRGDHRSPTDPPRSGSTDGHDLRVTSVEELGGQISEREAEVLLAVGERLTNAEIGLRLSISVRTVESHVSSLLRKLGATDRRDLAERARALAAPDRGSDRSSDERPVGGRLPAALTTFVGREAERAALTEALAAGRLVTVLGEGGVGKTRLATEVVAESAGLPARAWFVDLVPVSDPDAVFSAVAVALGIAERIGGESREAVLTWLADREVVLVLDNCEHVLAGASECIDAILRASPGTRVLATSRTRLLLPYETVFEVPGLSVEGEAGDAVTLFLERASAAGAVLGDEQRARVAAICRRLDGLALAIELAAARVPSLGLDGLEVGLDGRLQVLDAGPRGDDRHRSLRATLDWSCALLDESDRRLLRQVTVFAAEFTAEAATEVVDTGADDAMAVRVGLGRLVDQSMLRAAVTGGSTRYRALETVRQYGEDQLREAGELDAVRRRHIGWALRTARSLIATSDDPAWRPAFDAVLDDLRVAALRATTLAGADREDAHQLELSLGELLFQRGRPADAEQRYRAAARLAPDLDAQIAALRLGAGAAAARHAGDGFLELSREAADLALANGLPASAAVDLAVSASLVNRAPGIMAVRPQPGDADVLIDEAQALAVDDPLVEGAIAVARAFSSDEDNPESQRLAEQAVALGARSGNTMLESAALDQRTALHLASGELAEAVEDIRRRVELVEGIPVDATTGFEVTDVYSMACEVHLTVGDVEGARRYADAVAALPHHREQGHLATARRLRVDALAGRFDDVLELSDRFEAGWIDAGRPVVSNLAPGPAAVAMVHGILGNFDARDAWLAITGHLGSSIPFLFEWRAGWSPVFDATVSLHHGDAAAALERLEVEPAALRTWYNGMWRPWYAALWAEAAVLGGLASAGDRLAPARESARDNPVALVLIDRAEALLREDREALPPIAARLDAASMPYQRDRTLALADAR
jgi:predicted ATPase/DNA-binding CsgD family transcriptional regulator